MSLFICRNIFYNSSNEKKNNREFINTATKKISQTFKNKCDILSLLDFENIEETV